MKHSTHKPVGMLTSLKVAGALWQELTVNLVTDLPEDKGYMGVYTVINQFSKEIVLFLVIKSVSTVDLAQGFHVHVWKQHETLQSVLSDCRPQFASSFTQALCKLLRIKSIMSSPYHPQTDRLTEQMQQTWQHYLHAYITEDKKWIDTLSMLEFAYNSSSY